MEAAVHDSIHAPTRHRQPCIAISCWLQAPKMADKGEGFIINITGRSWLWFLECSVAALLGMVYVASPSAFWKVRLSAASLLMKSLQLPLSTPRPCPCSSVVPG
jgi:hypothetical protein